jgi:hypothetical protein
VVGLLCLAAGSVFAAVSPTSSLPADLFTVKAQHSRSGQFIVRGMPVGSSITQPKTGLQVLHDASKDDLKVVRLDPAVMAVSCERLKSRVLQELDLADNWRGVIHIEIHRIVRDNEPIRITTFRFADSWSYTVSVPALVDRDRLTRALVQVLLAELANRKVGAQPAELPYWLVAGFSAHLLAATPDLMSPTPSSSIVTRQVDLDAMRPFREVLRWRPALSFDELSWPDAEHLGGNQAEFYNRCAGLFVHELLGLRNGRACLAYMIRRLPEHLNWQITFLEAFRMYFPRLVEVSKWWSLVVIHFAGQEPKSAFTFEHTLGQLEEILLAPALVRRSPKELPEQTALPLQAIMSQWNFGRQALILVLKINHLCALRLRAAPELLPLIDGYVQTLDSYLARREQTSRLNSHKQQAFPSPKLITRDALQRLNELDAQRRALRDPMRVKAISR